MVNNVGYWLRGFIDWVCRVIEEILMFFTDIVIGDR